MKQLYFILAAGLIAGSTACHKDKDNDEPTPEPKTITHIVDGRSVKYGDAYPIMLDVNEDESVDFIIFVELTAGATGDHLYVGINPIGTHFVKSGPPDYSRYLNMGFAIKEDENGIISEQLEQDQYWTSEHSSLAIRHTGGNGSISYEGPWSNEEAAIVGFALIQNETPYFGWMKLQYDKSVDKITLMEYAWETTANQSIVAGDF